MKRAKYKVITSKNGFQELEETVSRHLNQGWKPIGGIAFNNGFPYQAMAKVEDVKPLTANQAMQVIDNLT